MPGHQRTAFVLDDVTAVASAQRDFEAPGGSTPITELSRFVRARNIGLLLCAHGYNVLSPQLRANLQTKYLLRLSGEDPRLIQHGFGFTPGQIDRARTLAQDEVIIAAPSIWPKPMLGKVPLFITPGQLTEAQRQSLNQRFWDSVHATKVGALPVPSSGASQTAAQHATSPNVGSTTSATPTGTPKAEPRQSDEEWRFMVMAASPPPRRLTILYDEMGLTRRKGAALVKRLRNKGWIHYTQLSQERRAGRVAVVAPTDAGWQFLAKLGIRRPPMHLQGSWLHDIPAQERKHSARNRHCTVNCEVPVADVFRIDVIESALATGKRIFSNVGVSSPEREAKIAWEMVNHPVLDGHRFVLVGLDVPFLRRVRNELRTLGGVQGAYAKVEFRTIADFLDPHADPFAEA